MSNTIPCPNPVCTHGFNQTELSSAAQLLCPKCGFRMQGKAPSKPAAPPGPAKVIPTAAPTKAKVAKPTKAEPATTKVAKPAATAKVVNAAAPPKPMIAQAAPAPAAKVVAAIPVQASPAPVVAKPVLSAANVSEPIPASNPDQSTSEEADANGAYFNPPVADESIPIVRTSKHTSKMSWTRLALILLATGFVGCILLVVGGIAYLLYKNANPGNGGGGILTADDVVHTGSIRDAKGLSEKIYRLVLNKKEWSVDNEISAKLGAHTAWKHNEHDFWFALVVKDHTVFRPRDAEMLRFAIDKLESQFGDALELGAKAEPTKVGALSAQKIQFKGQVKSANWLGECHMFFKDGIAYYLFLSSPDWAVVEKFAIAFPEKHLAVLAERRGWREQAPPMETYASLNTKMTASVPKGVWEKANAKDEDENGELFVVGKYLKEKDNRKNASMLIFTIPAKEDLKDAMKAGRDYWDSKIKNDMSGFKVAHAGEVSEGQSELGSVEDVGNRRGRIIDLKKMFNEEAKRYYLMAVVNEPELTYVVLCECAWESRQIWRQDFLEVLRSLHFKKTE